MPTSIQNSLKVFWALIGVSRLADKMLAVFKPKAANVMFLLRFGLLVVINLG